MLPVQWWKERRVPYRQILIFIIFALIGAVVVPGAFVGYFAAKGALQDMYYCVIQHNMAGSNTNSPNSDAAI